MSKSLQDQLLALGLAKERVGKKVGERAREKTGQAPKPKSPANTQGAVNKPGPQQAASKGPKATDDISLEQAYRIRESVEKSEKQKARERKMEEDRKRAELNRSIRKIIDEHRLNLADAEEARYFMYKKRIRKVHVSADQLALLNVGQLGVVYLGGGYHILANDHVEVVRNISPTHVPDLLAGGDDDEDLWAAYEQQLSSAVPEDQADDQSTQSADLTPE